MKTSNFIAQAVLKTGIGLACFATLPAAAQKKLALSKPVIALSAENDTVGSSQNLLCLDIATNVDIAVTSSQPWATIIRNNKNVYVKVAENTDEEARTALITIADKDKKARSRYVRLVQQRSNASEYVLGDIELKVSSAKTNTYQPGGEIEKSIDGNFSTTYHSQWSAAISKENPAILEYFFTSTDQIDYLTYHPRPGGGNGNFAQLEIWYKTASDNDYVKFGDFDFNYSSSPTSITFPQPLKNPRAIKFVVNSGTGNFASCSEMKFFKIRERDPEFDIFGDELCTTLKEGVAQTDIDALENPFIRNLAQKLFNKEYNTEYRVSQYECLLSPQALSEQWSTPGKLYDQVQGATGIMLRPGKTIVMASGIPANKSVGLRVIGWTVEDLGTFKNGFKSEQYALRNGVNIIDKTSDWNGLAYLDYFDYNPEQYADSPVKIHIVNGKVNGILSPDKSNEEMDEILRNAAYTTIDLMGSRVHSVWETSALLTYTKGQYRRYMNVLDTLIAWEHRLIGLEKYNRIPKNKTLAYVNYDYYMYQGGMGVTFKYDTQYRCCSPDNIMYRDDDVVWGLSHEWGHQHQMNPYFCWAGLSESSNNMNSCYNVLHMGYTGSRVSNGWQRARTDLLNDGAKRTVSGARSRAYYENSRWSWNTELRDLARSMVNDTIIPAQTDNLERSVSINEVNVESNLAPFFMLHCHFTPTLPDYTPDLYEALRCTDTNEDKYAILAGAQNGVSGKYDQYKATYPNSVWITRNYIQASSSTWLNSVPYIFNYVRNASKISGYNLYPYFEKWGFFRLIANVIGDYGDKLYAMTKEMKDEFKADMEKLVTEGYTDKDGNTIRLKTMPEEMINEISNAPIPRFQTPDIPN